MTHYQNDSPDDGYVSKSQRKRDMDALQDLGRELVELSKDTLKKMQLPEDLLTAILDYKRFTAHGALRRQLQYIGKLMRDVDPEPIQQYLLILKGESSEHIAWQHLLERWRERLMEDDKMLASFVSDFPAADPQQLRTLIRNARKEKQDNKPPKSFRLLYQAIKDVIPELASRACNSRTKRTTSDVEGRPGFHLRPRQQRRLRRQGHPGAARLAGRRAGQPFAVVARLIPDEQPQIEATLKALVDEEGRQLVLTTGGTGPAARDVTPEATLAVADREMPGFGEQMRQISLRFVPTAILSRQVGVIRKQALILNLPGQPKAIKETLEGLRGADGQVEVPGIFAAVPYCIDLLDGPYIETHEAMVKAFRPKSAQKNRPEPWLTSPRLAARRPCPNHLAGAGDQDEPTRLPPRAVGYAGWRPHRAGLRRRTARRAAGGAVSRLGRQQRQPLRARADAGRAAARLERRGAAFPRLRRRGQSLAARLSRRRRRRGALDSEPAGATLPVLAAAAVSLGGSMLLNYLADEGAQALPRAAAAVSAPLDLVAASTRLDRGLGKLLYTRMFMDTLAQGAGIAAAPPRPVRRRQAQPRAHLHRVRRFGHRAHPWLRHRAQLLAKRQRQAATGSDRPPHPGAERAQRPLSTGTGAAAPGRGRGLRHAGVSAPRRPRRLRLRRLPGTLDWSPSRLLEFFEPHLD